MKYDNLLPALGAGIIMITAVLAIGCRGKGIRGVYQCVSESEYVVTVDLREESVALVIHESWLPGEFDSSEIDTLVGRWYTHNDLILLEYNQIVDTLVFCPQLSLGELGLEGGAPGLKQLTGYSPHSLIGGESLWRLPHNF